jgi:threonine/homoserine/homoserine lactone efflux protein
MLGTTDLAMFVAAGLLLNITPGPDMLYILGRTVSQGRRGGTVAALGIAAGLWVHTVAAAIGLSALLAASAMAYTIVKWLGAIYLVYVGMSLLISRPTVREQPPALRAASLRSVFVQGFLTNVLNPKVALFFLAFLPQFVDPGTSNKPLALLFLGFVFIFNGTLWNLIVVWSTARMARRFDPSHRFALWLSRTVGALFVYLGVSLVVSRES